MRVIINFMLRDGILIHCIAEDAKTVVSDWTSVHDQPTLVHLLRYVGATDAEVAETESDMHRWSRGGVHVTLAVGKRNLLRIKPEYATPLGLW